MFLSPPTPTVVKSHSQLPHFSINIPIVPICSDFKYGISFQISISFGMYIKYNHKLYSFFYIVRCLPRYPTNTAFIQTLFTSLQHIALQTVPLPNSLQIYLSCNYHIFLKQGLCFLDTLLKTSSLLTEGRQFFTSTTNPARILFQSQPPILSVTTAQELIHPLFYLVSVCPVNCLLAIPSFQNFHLYFIQCLHPSSYLILVFFIVSFSPAS